jgi:hypothetical protein
MNFSPKNCRMTKFQSSFNDKETIDKTSSLFKSKSNIVMDLRCKDTLKESQIIYEEIVTIGGIKAGEMVNSKEPESCRKLNESITKERLNEEKLDKKNSNFNKESEAQNDSEIKNQLFADATNIKCDNSVYLSDNLSILADKENIQKILPNCGHETNFIKDFGINTFDLSPILDFNSFCEKEIILNENKFNTIEVSKIENYENRERDIKTEKSQKRYKTNNSQSHKIIDTVKIKKLESNSNRKSRANNLNTKPKNEIIISNFNLEAKYAYNKGSGYKNKNSSKLFGETTNFNNINSNNFNSKQIGSTRKRANTKQPSNYNYQTNLQPLEALSNFATIDKDKLPSITNKFSEKNKKTSVSLEKYRHVFGDVVNSALNHNKSNKKMPINEDADMSNFRSRLDSTQIRNPFSTNSLNRSPEVETNTDGILKKNGTILSEEIKNTMIN